MSRIPRIAVLVLVLLVGAYAAAGYLLVPWLLPGQVEGVLAEQLSLQSRVESVRFDPFGLRLEIGGFAMGESLDAPGAAADELWVDLAVGPLLGGRVVVDELHLGNPLVVLRIDPSGSMRIAGVAIGGADEAPPEAESEEGSKPEAETEPEPDDGRGPLAELSIRKLSISGGRFQVVDASRDPVVDRGFGPIELRADGLNLTDLLRSDTDPEDGSPAELAIALGDGATLSASGDIDVDPLRLDLQLGLTDFPLASLQPYVSPVAALQVRDGRLTVNGRLRLGAAQAETDGTAASEDAPARAHFEGDLGLASLDLRAAEGADATMIGWKGLDVSGIDVVSEPLAIKIASVKLTAPQVLALQEANGLNLARAFSRSEPTREVEAPAADAGREDTPVPVEVGPIEITGGHVRFEDRTLDPPYHIDLKDLTAHVDRFAMDDASRSAVDLSTEVDGYAPVTLVGSLAPLAPRQFLEMQFAAKGLELEAFSPYTGRFVGRRIDGGQGTVDVEMKVVKHALVSQTQIVLDKLAFGDTVASPDATSLPVAAATSLLADGDGRISLDVPVEGNFDDPSFSYLGQLLGTLRTLVTRVVATPFKLVDGMVSYGGQLFAPEEMSRVSFEAEDHDLLRSEKAKLDALGKALRENPGLYIEIRAGAAPELDGDADELRGLARRRAKAIREHLQEGGVPEDQIRIGEVRIDADTAVSEDRVVTQLAVR